MEIDEGGSNFPKDVFDPKMHRNNKENDYLVSHVMSIFDGFL